jgi:PAS domain S-box-containing protein
VEGQPLAAILPAGAAEPIGHLLARVRETGEGGELELEVGPDTRWLVIARDAGGGILGLAVNDVTERGTAALELRESERQLAAAQRIARMGWWVGAAGTAEVRYSAALAAILGLGPDDDGATVTEPAWQDRVVPEDRERANAAATAAVRERRVMELELRARRPDGVPLRIRVRATPILDAAGEVVGLQGLTQDVTASERAGRLQRAVAEAGRLALEDVPHDELVERTCRLAAQALDVEWAGVIAAADGSPAAETSVLRCPIPGPDGPRGTLAAATAVPRRFADEEAAFLESIAHVLGEAATRREAAEEIAELAAARGRLVMQALDAEARARRGISDRLHDGPLQDLLAAANDLYGLGDGAAATAAQERVRAIARDLREVMVALHPTVLRYGGLDTALQAVVSQQAHAAGIRAAVTVDPEATGVQDELLLSLTRQLAGDATQHAGASRLSVAVRRAGTEIVLEIADDGRPDPERVELDTVAERVAGVGGRVEVSSGAPGGTRTRIFLPVRRIGSPSR